MAKGRFRSFQSGVGGVTVSKYFVYYFIAKWEKNVSKYFSFVLVINNFHIFLIREIKHNVYFSRERKKINFCRLAFVHGSE